jgi:hypothetical protein
MGETIRQLSEHPANASTNRSGRYYFNASAVPEKRARMRMQIK